MLKEFDSFFWRKKGEEKKWINLTVDNNQKHSEGT